MLLYYDILTEKDGSTVLLCVWPEHVTIWRGVRDGLFL